MPTLAFLVPGALDTRTGGYGYDRRLIAGLRGLGWTVDVQALDASFPRPTSGARASAAAALASLPDGALAVVDGLAFGVLAEEAERERDRLRLVALVHHPLAFETGLSHEAAREFAASERRGLAAARLVIVTSEETARALDGYGVPRARVAVVEPGTEPARLARGSTDGLRLLSVGSIVPRKGFRVLVDALSRLADRPWRLVIAGSAERDPAEAARLREAIRVAHLESRVTLAGELADDALAQEFDCADGFVLATFYEGYGMAVAEALARGLPVVSTPTGGISDLVGDDAGVLVPAGDVDALAAALATLMDDESARRHWAEGAALVRERLASWSTAAVRMAAALASLDEDQADPGFSADWLALREPVDARARSTAIVRQVAHQLDRALVDERPMSALDLGGGTGSNIRYLSPLMPRPIEWTIADQDARLLDVAQRLSGPLVDRCRIDLSTLDGHEGLFAGRDLITASALLDLVSARWLGELIEQCRRARAAVIFALTYDGRISCSPVEPEDTLVRDLVNLHQRIDKGFGAALGPAAGAEVVHRLKRSGYEVWSAASDWQLDGADAVMQAALIDGWATAASAVAPVRAAAIADWRVRRLAHIDGGRSAMVVGHVDVGGVLR